MAYKFINIIPCLVERGVWGVVESRRGRFLIWLIISIIKRNLWLARKDLVERNRDWGVEGVVRRMEGDLVQRIKWDVEKWGYHAALERWKGGLGLDF